MGVCVSMYGIAKMFKAFSFHFTVYLGYGSNSGLKVIFFSKLLVSVLLQLFAIVVFINKAFKLFKLVLVVYWDSCCHW